jgi:hypothetical protein
MVVGLPSMHLPSIPCSKIQRSQVRAGSHGVPSPTHDSKSQHVVEAPTFEPQETIKIWLIIIKVGS